MSEIRSYSAIVIPLQNILYFEGLSNDNVTWYTPFLCFLFEYLFSLPFYFFFKIIYLLQ